MFYLWSKTENKNTHADAVFNFGDWASNGTFALVLTTTNPKSVVDIAKSGFAGPIFRITSRPVIPQS